jgi:hypothetical protein
MDAAIQHGKARTKESKATMNSTAKTNIATLPSSPKAQTAKDVIASALILSAIETPAATAEQAEGEDDPDPDWRKPANKIFPS